MDKLCICESYKCQFTEHKHNFIPVILSKFGMVDIDSYCYCGARITSKIYEYKIGEKRTHPKE